MTMNIYIVRAQDSGVLKVLLEAFKYLSPEDIDPEEYDIQDDLLRVRHLFQMLKFLYVCFTLKISFTAEHYGP